VIELLLAAERSLAVGQIDAAERQYRQAIDNDPRNSIAVVGLARVALERNDDQSAYRFALRALEIDPENAAAQRLATRLAEVMRHRGEQPPTGGAPTAPAVADGVTPQEPKPVPRRRGLVGRILGR
jgi:tetratricopeptide (TPR) repeat protein